MTLAIGQLAIEPLAALPTWFGIGGRADHLAQPETVEDLVACLEFDPDLRMLGDGANLLVDDPGVGGLVVSLQTPGFKHVEIEESSGAVVAGAGAKLPQLINETIRHGLGGLETLAGIPATVGGALIMNAGGAFGQIADAVHSVTGIDRHGRTHTLARDQIGFGYRRSGLNHLIITGAEFRLTPGDRVDLRHELMRCMAYKKDSQPLKDRSAGCVFKNPILSTTLPRLGDVGDRVPAGLLLNRAGCKGLCVGGATVSEHHANFVVTTPDAKARHVIELIGQSARRVRDTFGVSLHRELVVWSRNPLCPEADEGGHS